MSESTVAERIKLVVETVANKTSEFLKATGLSHQNIHDLTSGRSAGPSYPTTTKILSAYPQINANWLLTGEGEMLISDAQAQKNLPYTPDHNNVQAYALLSDIPVVELPHVSFKARASFGYAQLQRYKHSDIFDTVLHRLPPGKTAEDYKDAIVFDIEGDSMEPSLVNGQQVIAWPIPESKWEQLYNATCIVAYDDTVTVKRITDNELFTANRLTLRATGNGGGSFAVSRAAIQSIYQVREFYGPQPYRFFM
jgi:hypothetical protein